ncbi:MAG: two component transcriptional regulator [uncultured bacterium]|nr:MAG: two component transcriptional regulator [uncultured bacterium]
MRICIIEDEMAIITPLKRMLERAGFAVDYAVDGQTGLALVRHNQYDCILLDLNLPVIDGLTLIQKLRSDQVVTPVIMLTARSQVYDKLEGFTNGADDYVTKPFHLEELLARIRAVIKRASSNQTNQLRFAQYTLYPEKNIIENMSSTNKKEIILTSKETSILEYLLRHPDHVISAEELLEHVWDQEVNLFTDTVKTHIKTLRQKIDPKKQLILTIRGKGYKVKSL